MSGYVRNMKHTTNLVLVFGKLCSGKGTYCGYFPEYTKIVTSDVVKHITGKNTRSELHKTAHLDQEIATELVARIKTLLDKNCKVIVDGIRQRTIVEYVLNNFSDVKMVWLEVPNDVLKQRFLSRNDNKDDQTFEEAYQKDSILGLRDLEGWLKQDNKVEIINHLN